MKKIKIYFEAEIENKNGVLVNRTVSSNCIVEKVNDDGTMLLKIDSMDTLSNYAIYNPKDESVILQ